MSPNWRIVIGSETYEFDVYDLFGTYEFYRATITVSGREFSDQGRSDEGRECVRRIADELINCQYDVREIIPPNEETAAERAEGARACGRREALPATARRLAETVMAWATTKQCLGDDALTEEAWGEVLEALKAAGYIAGEPRPTMPEEPTEEPVVTLTRVFLAHVFPSGYRHDEFAAVCAAEVDRTIGNVPWSVGAVDVQIGSPSVVSIPITALVATVKGQSIGGMCGALRALVTDCMTTVGLVTTWEKK